MTFKKVNITVGAGVVLQKAFYNLYSLLYEGLAFAFLLKGERVVKTKASRNGEETDEEVLIMTLSISFIITQHLQCFISINFVAS